MMDWVKAIGITIVLMALIGITPLVLATLWFILSVAAIAVLVWFILQLLKEGASSDPD